MITNEYETNEQLEMVFLYHIGIPYEVDRSNQRRIKMIFKGDLDFIKGKLEDFWNGNTRVDARKYSNDWQSVKRMMWIGGSYNPEMHKNVHGYKKLNEKKDETTEQAE